MGSVGSIVQEAIHNDNPNVISLKFHWQKANTFFVSEHAYTNVIYVLNSKQKFFTNLKMLPKCFIYSSNFSIVSMCWTIK